MIITTFMIFTRKIISAGPLFETSWFLRITICNYFICYSVWQSTSRYLHTTVLFNEMKSYKVIFGYKLCSVLLFHWFRSAAMCVWGSALRPQSKHQRPVNSRHPNKDTPASLKKPNQVASLKHHWIGSQMLWNRNQNSNDRLKVVVVQSVEMSGVQDLDWASD